MKDSSTKKLNEMTDSLIELPKDEPIIKNSPINKKVSKNIPVYTRKVIIKKLLYN